MSKRRTIPAQLKAKAALEATRGEKTVNQIAAKYEVHPTQVSHWKRHLNAHINDPFQARRTREKQDNDELISQLYQQIGQLKFELDWLKKKVGYDD